MSKLAIEGGEKAVRKLGPYTSKIHKEELEEVLDLWEYPAGVKNKLVAIIEKNAGRINGPHLFRYYNPRPSKVTEAENAFAKYIGAKHALAVNSCTSALIASLRALGIGMGDEVIVPAYTFFASAAVIVACNAIPVIADIDETLTLDPKDVARRITPRTKAIIVVHMRGMPARMDELMTIARERNIPVIEDVAQAAGGMYKGKMLGSIGTMGCFSFDYYKVLNSGEGGFITTNDPWLYTRAQSWHDCAACWRPNRFEAERREGELFCGENYRMSELQGAVALAQIRKAKKFLKGYRAAKKSIVKKLILPKGAQLQPVADSVGDTGICLVLFMPDVATTRRALAAMQAEGVPAGGIYDHKVKDWHIYVYWEHILDRKSVARDGLPWSGVPADQLPAYSTNMCPRSTDLLSRAIMIDIHWEFSAADCSAIAKGINKVMATI
ncbi:MAG: DegT/DnrJ/EryC1/StrS family aminotransferase [Verrucomicrobiota bacterium]|nr:DegT/DnrJ/EryC1/StrS family aminotransferase [Verrucomicrobiota bacterium]